MTTVHEGTDWVDDLTAGTAAPAPNPHAHCNTLSSRRCPTDEHDNARSSLIGGLRALAEYLERHPDVSCPQFARPQVSYLRGSAEDKRAAMRRDASRMGVDLTEYEHNGDRHISADMPFGDAVTLVLHANLGPVPDRNTYPREDTTAPLPPSVEGYQVGGAAPRELTLERKDQPDKSPTFGGGAVVMTPPIDEDYWLFRVRLSDKQAIVGFPKFSTVGIGFAVEEDWNTNLPYTCAAKEIFNHIKHNKGEDAISDEDCVRAIEMVREAAAEWKAAQS